MNTDHEENVRPSTKRSEINDAAKNDVKCVKRDTKKCQSSDRFDIMFSSDDDLDLGTSYVPTIAQKKTSTPTNNAEQKKPCWLSDTSPKANTTASVDKNKNKSFFDDSLDDFVFNGKKSQTRRSNDDGRSDQTKGNPRVGRRSSSNNSTWLLAENEKEERIQQKQDDFFAEDESKTMKRQRRRGQNGNDAADELRKLAEFGF